MFIKTKIPTVLWISVVTIVLLSFPALAQMSSSNYKIPVSVMDASGTQKNSDNYKIKDAIGQPTPIGDPKTSTNYKLISGFIYGSGQVYIPGDANWRSGNSDCVVDINDALYVLNYLFRKGPCPHPMAAGDVNCDCIVNLNDAIFLLDYLFRNGSAPMPGCVDSDP
jgi:hypothetical protein